MRRTFFFYSVLLFLFSCLMIHTHPTIKQHPDTHDHTTPHQRGARRTASRSNPHTIHRPPRLDRLGASDGRTLAPSGTPYALRCAPSVPRRTPSPLLGCA